MENKNENKKNISIFDLIVNKAQSWGKAVLFFGSILFFLFMFYFQVDTNTMNIDSNFKFTQEQIKTIEDRINKKHERQQEDIQLNAKKIERLEYLIDKVKNENEKIKGYIEGKEYWEKKVIDLIKEQNEK